MKPVLFLDFDGVLHPDGCSTDQEFCRLHHFQEALRELPGIPPIVISSSWRFNGSLEWLRGHFAGDIARHIVGATPNIHGFAAHAGRGSRQREIEAWLANQAPGSPWVALDDHAAGFDEGCPHLMLTNRRLGVQFDELEDLKRRLQDVPHPEAHIRVVTKRRGPT